CGPNEASVVSRARMLSTGTAARNSGLKRAAMALSRVLEIPPSIISKTHDKPRPAGVFGTAGPSFGAQETREKRLQASSAVRGMIFQRNPGTPISFKRRPLEDAHQNET